MSADEQILTLEQQIFAELTASLLEYVAPVQGNAALAAQLDCLLCFAGLARRRGWVRPKFADSGVMDIIQGRHPVIEEMLPVGERYVANDVFLDQNEQQIIILTGPNMSGKSALLRQTALMALMAQMGCYVPAQSAVISIVDKIFTRVGASDNISQGESTFMVEMQEAASILNNLSHNSLILLDEIGRGTSTYDGISIACAMIEYIHNHPAARAKTIFATHYHELNDMAEKFARIKNFSVSTREAAGRVVFLRKLTAGGSAHSFGIHVAQMAGMPRVVTDRAAEILKDLERKPSPRMKAVVAAAENPMQLSFFEIDDPVVAQIRLHLHNLDLNALTPIDALNKLNEIQRVVNA